MILDQFKLDGRVALVTGAAQGLGRGIAAGLAEAGADLVLLDVQDAAETAAEIAAIGRSAHRILFDLLDRSGAHAAEIVETTLGLAGRLDILVNNAGIIRRAAALDYAEADWQAVLDVNLSAAFYFSQAAAKYWVDRRQPGKIINVCSMLSFQGGVRVPAYAAAKSGLVGLTRALANEWAPHGINVNGLAPGYFATDVTAGLREDPERSAAILSRIPAGRWGEPNDLKGAAVFLASDASSYVHGTILAVDGGWLAW